jgi:hypothetical protein
LSNTLGRSARALCIGAAFAAVTASAFAQSASDVRVDVNLKDADMLTATRMLFAKTGVQFVVKPSANPYGKITLKLDGVSAEEAVRYICESAGAYFRRDEAGVFIISHDRPVEAPAATVAEAVQPKALKKIRVLKADAKSVFDQVVYHIPFDSMKGFEDLKRFTNLTSNDQQRIFGDNLSVYGAEANTARLHAITSTSLASEVPTSSNDIALPGESVGQFGVGGGGGGRGGGGGGQGGRGGGGGGGLGGGGGQGGGGGGQGGGGGSVTFTPGQGLIGASIDHITFDPTDNSIIVRGNEDDIAQLQSYINTFDVAPRQVQIKVEFISTQEGFDKDLGYEFNYQRGTVFAGTQPGSFINSSAPVFLNYATGNIAMRLRAALTENNSKVVNAPILRTLNNQPASVFQSQTSYIFTPTTTGIAGAGVITTYQQTPIQAGTNLSIAPRINGDDTVTVYLAPNIGGFQGTSVSPTGQTIPNTFNQGISVVARVKNNETIVLGGFTSKTDNNTLRKVPILADLPIVGQFFRSFAKSRSNSELLIFVTPTIIEDDSSSTIGP